MPVDLILYAIIAALLVFWLRSVLGTRHGEERERPTPFSVSEGAVVINGEVLPAAPVLGMEEKIAKLFETSGNVKSIENKTAQNGLIDIARADKHFDIDAFLDGAQDAFAMIVESFAEGDRETLKNLLDNPVYKAFESAILEREAKGETQITDIHALRKVQVTAARLEGKMAFITVGFTADETSITRDNQGQILAGHPDKITQMHDIWTFGRDIKSKDPSWLVFETRADCENDNDLLPNSHEHIKTRSS